MDKKILEVGLNLPDVMLQQKHHFFCINGRTRGRSVGAFNTLKTDSCNNVKIINDSSTFSDNQLQRMAKDFHILQPLTASLISEVNKRLGGCGAGKLLFVRGAHMPTYGLVHLSCKPTREALRLLCSVHHLGLCKSLMVELKRCCVFSNKKLSIDLSFSHI